MSELANAAREVAAWFRSGNRIPVDASRLPQNKKFLEDVKRLDKAVQAWDDTPIT
jgi:hypothetical protein